MTKKFGLGGFSLVELLAAIALVSIILAIIFPQFASIVRYSASTRKAVKTQSDVFSDLEQMFKEISSAGFGLPVTNANLSESVCVRAGNSAVVIDGKSLTVRSAGLGNKTGAGRWGVVDESVSVLMSVSNVLPPPDGSYVMVIDTVDASLRKLAIFKVVNSSGTLQLQTVKKYAPDDVIKHKIAYWIPTYSNSNICECYETTFYLDSYSSSNKPSMCAEGTSVLKRDQDPPDGGGTSPVLDCVKELEFRVGCVDSNGKITWSTSCGPSQKLKMVRLGMVVQSGVREKEEVFPYSNLSLFGDLGSGSVIVTLEREERHYRWITAEKIISLPNVE